MDRTAASLLAFAAGPENLERRAAAMLMLAELKLDDARTGAVVAEALASDTVLQEYALRYVEKLRPAAVLPAVLALLDAAPIPPSVSVRGACSSTTGRRRSRRSLVAPKAPDGRGCSARSTCWRRLRARPRSRRS